MKNNKLANFLGQIGMSLQNQSGLTSNLEMDLVNFTFVH